MKKIISYLRVRPILLGLCSGILLSIGYRVPGLWIVLFIALVPLLYGITTAKSKVKVVLAGASAGIPLMGTATFWFFGVLPLPTSYGLSSPLIGLLFVTLSWLLVILVTGVVVGFWALAVSYFKIRSVIDLFVVAFLWIGGEFLRLLTFNALTFSPDIHNPAFFSAGFLAYPLMDSENLRQLASLGGVYVCSFFVVLINVAVFYCLTQKITQNKKLKLCAVLIGIPVLFALIPIVKIKESLDHNKTAQVKIAIMSVDVPPNLDETQTFAPIATQELSYIQKASTQNVDMILLPEDSRLFIPFSMHTVGEYLSPGSNAVVNDSGRIQTASGTHPLRLFADTRGGIIPVRDKLALTPQGEYIPYLFQLFLYAIGEGKKIDTFSTIRGYTTGEGTPPSFIVGDSIKAVTFFCLEIMDPGLGIAQKQKDGDNVILVPAAHLLFKPSYILEQDVLRFSQAQAVTLQLPLATSVKQGPAFILDAYGTTVTSVGRDYSSGMQIATIQVPVLTK